MASNLLSSVLGGGGGSFIASASYPTEILSSALTGTIKTLTPPSGKRIKITSLTASDIMTSLTTVSRGGIDVVTDVVLTTGSIPVGNQWVIENGMNEIVGEIDEEIELKTNVATSHNIRLLYQEGV